VFTPAEPAGQSPDNTYHPTNPTIAAGGTFDYDNQSIHIHNVFSNKRGPDGGPLFDTKTSKGPKTESVEGVQYLNPGTYDFHCTLHQDMKGTLTVTAGQPAPRPEIAVSIKSSKLKAVLRSGVLKAKVADSKTDGVVELVATRGLTTLASKSRIHVTRGDSENVSLKLSQDGKRALKGLNKAKIKLKGIVDFGSPDSAKKTLK
jgi:plastocyanin